MRFISRRLLRAVETWAAFIVLAMSVPAAWGAQPATAPSTPVRAGYPMVDFAFGLQDLQPAEQVELLTRLGYQGMVLADADLKVVNEYTDVEPVRTGAFRVYALLWWVKLDKPLDLQRLDAFLAPLAKLNAAVWIVIDGRKDQPEKVVDYLRQTADHCRAANVQIVLYPHAGTAFEDAEEALTVWQKLDRQEVKLSIHLCHELMHGNAARISEIVPKIAPLLALASVNGAELNHGNSWDWLIMPLDKGSYDPREYLRALMRNGYNGPMVLHTYGIKDPPEDHLKRSLVRWEQLMAELSEKTKGEGGTSRQGD